MKFPKSVSVSLILLILLGCEKDDPVADFTWEPLEPKVGEVVRFTNLSKHVEYRNSWLIKIDIEENPNIVNINRGGGLSYTVDGNSNTEYHIGEESPYIVFKQKGEYEIHLRAYGDSPYYIPAPLVATKIETLNVVE